jgi:hypothetical protein
MLKQKFFPAYFGRPTVMYPYHERTPEYPYYDILVPSLSRHVFHSMLLRPLKVMCSTNFCLCHSRVRQLSAAGQEFCWRRGSCVHRDNTTEKRASVFFATRTVTLPRTPTVRLSYFELINGILTVKHVGWIGHYMECIIILDRWESTYTHISHFAKGKTSSHLCHGNYQPI